MSRLLPSCLALLLSACSAPNVPAVPQPAGLDDEAPAPGIRTAEPSEPPDAAEPTPPPEPIAEEPTPAEPGEVWRFTTLVTGGPEPLIGANGYYELVLDENRATVRKVGERGTPKLPPGRVMEGSGTLDTTEDPAWPSARTGTMTVELAGASSKIRMSLRLWFLGDEVHGTWLHPDGKAEEHLIGRAWGLVEGVRGRGEPLTLVDGEHAPCWVCHQAFFTCEGVGSGACNSSNSAMAACNQRVRAASKRGAGVPRGCGDWMHEG